MAGVLDFSENVTRRRALPLLAPAALLQQWQLADELECRRKPTPSSGHRFTVMQTVWYASHTAEHGVYALT